MKLKKTLILVALLGVAAAAAAQGAQAAASAFNNFSTDFGNEHAMSLLAGVALVASIIKRSLSGGSQ